MQDLSEITLIIPTNNRHGYLRRILSYYRSVSIPIIIVDSTEVVFNDKIDSNKIAYNHCPKMPLPQKIRYALDQVETRYVVMCADDDFIIPEGLSVCIEYLNENPKFIAAQGNNISYKKQADYKSYIELNPMYLQQLDFEISNEDPFERLYKLFHPYRTIFSAVHYTVVLRKAFQNLDTEFRNLYLNEYLTAVVPILSGCYKELNVFYQVREYSLTSDDKTTDNLDVISVDPNYKEEFNSFLDYVSNISSDITHTSSEVCRNKIIEVFTSFCKEIAHNKQNMKKVSFTKRVGNSIRLLPVFGERIVLYRRLRQQRKEIAYITKTAEEKNQMNIVIKYIKEYAGIVN